MAAENFIHDLAEYLSVGNLSDLTLTFGEKSWQIHKALTSCHSTWFRKAITTGFEESQSGVVTLNDDPEFANAVDCMVSYFYKANYNVSQYDASEPLLHAQIAIIADKYDCASLYKLARTSFADTLKAIEKDDWAVVTTFVYDHTMTDWPPHEDLRGLVVAAIVKRPDMLKSFLEMESTPGLFRSTLDLATDLLLNRPYVSKAEDVHKHIFTCGKCQYTHVGSNKCAYVASLNHFIYGKTCPHCGKRSGVTPERHAYTVGMFESFSCPSCDGIHNLEPVSELQPLTKDASS